MSHTPGQLIILCGPSGSGKTSIQNLLVERNPTFFRSISATTRPPREGEVDGVDYYFITKEEFEDGMRAWRSIDEPQPKYALLEHTTYGGHYYGTPGSPIHDALILGKTIIVVLDIPGALAYKEHSLSTTTIFIEPPNVEEIKNRLAARSSNGEEDQSRLEKVAQELEDGHQLDYVVRNTNLDTAVAETEMIVAAARARWHNRFLLSDEQRAHLNGELDFPITIKDGNVSTLRELIISKRCGRPVGRTRKDQKALYLARLKAGYIPKTVTYLGGDRVFGDEEIQRELEHDGAFSDNLIELEMGRLDAILCMCNTRHFELPLYE